MQSESQETQLHRRGDPSPVNPDLVFLRYRNGREVWVSKERRDKVRSQSKKSNAKQRAKPEHKEKMKLYFREYNQRPHQKARLSAYYKQSEVRSKIREKYAPISEAKKKAKAARETPEYFAAKKEARAKKVRDNYRVRYATDMVYRAKYICRARIADALKYAKANKFSNTKDLLGCSYEFFRGWIESRFERGMSWGNFGIFWEIDHDRPIASYDLTKESEQRAAFHYSNCQPMWKDMNRAKSDRMPGEHFRGRHIRQTN